MTRSAAALVLDFGGPVLLTPFELTARTERRLGLRAGSLPWRGPFDPGSTGCQSADSVGDRMTVQRHSR